MGFGRKFGPSEPTHKGRWHVPDLSPNFVGWEGSPTKIDKSEKDGTLILTALLEDLAVYFKVDQARNILRDTYYCIRTPDLGQSLSLMASNRH